MTVLALLFGGMAAVAAALTYAVATMILSLLPGGIATRPETPLGYVIFPLLVVATLGPFLAIPASLLGGVWVVALRRTLRPAGSE